MVGYGDKVLKISFQRKLQLSGLKFSNNFYIVESVSVIFEPIKFST